MEEQRAYWFLYNHLTNTVIKINKSPFHAGRGKDQDVECRSNKVSRNHALFITKPDNTLHVQDCGSSNGTYVNRNKIVSSVLWQLHVNDEVGLGLHSETDAVQINAMVDNQYVYIVRRYEPPIVISDDEDDSADGLGNNIGSTKERKEVPNIKNENETATLLTPLQNLHIETSTNNMDCTKSSDLKKSEHNNNNNVPDLHIESSLNNINCIKSSDLEKSKHNNSIAANMHIKSSANNINCIESSDLEKSEHDNSMAPNLHINSSAISCIKSSDPEKSERNNNNVLKPVVTTNGLICHTKQVNKKPNRINCKTSADKNENFSNIQQLHDVLAFDSPIKNGIDQEITKTAVNKSASGVKMKDNMFEVECSNMSTKTNKMHRKDNTNNKSFDKSLQNEEKENNTNSHVSHKKNTNVEPPSNQHLTFSKDIVMQNGNDKNENFFNTQQLHDVLAFDSPIKNCIGQEMTKIAVNKSASGVKMNNNMFEAGCSNMSTKTNKMHREDHTNKSFDKRLQNKEEQDNTNSHVSHKENTSVEPPNNQEFSFSNDIVMQNDNDIEKFIKKEIKEEYNSIDVSYTVNDGIIIIDDDVQELPPSQLFDDTIKRELEALDCPINTEMPYTCINLAYDSDFEDGEDWYKEFIGPSNVNVQNGELLVGSPEYEVSPVSDGNEQIKALISATTPHADQNTLTPEGSAGNSDNKITIGAVESWFARNKSKRIFKKPEIIPPHKEIKTKTRNENTKRTDKRNTSPEKRKLQAKDERSTSKNKRSKRGDNKPVELFSKEEKEKIHTAQKRKLKEIADMKREEMQKRIETKTKATAAPVKVKVSSNTRGTFLTKSCSIPSTSKGISHSIPSTSKRVSWRIPSTSKGIPHSISSTSKAIPHTIPQKTAPPLNRNYSHNKLSNVTVPHEKLTPLLPQSCIPNHTVGYNLNHLQPVVVLNGFNNNNNSNSIYHNRVNNNDLPLPSSCHGIEDILFSLLSWKPTWFADFKQRNILPPFMQEQCLQRMLQNFNSCEEYYNIVRPYLELELFNEMFKGINITSDPRREKQTAKIEDERKKPNHIELHCSTYIDQEQIDNCYYVKVEDVVMIHFVIRQNNQTMAVTLNGYVIDVSKRIIQGSEYIDANFAKKAGVSPYGKLSFTVMVERYSGNVVKGIYADYGHAMSLTPFKRVVKSVKYLKYSPLCQHVLKPTIDLYRVPKVRYDRIHFKDRLNENQYQAVLEATFLYLRKEPSIYLIQGPPGTGKSTVIINIIQQILFSNQHGTSKPPCILVTAPSNAAVDEIAMRLINLRSTLDAQQSRLLKLIRIGPKSMVHANVKDYYLEEVVRKNTVIEILKDSSKSNVHAEIRMLDENFHRLKHDCKTHQGKQKFNAAKKALDNTLRRVLDPEYYKRIEESVIVHAKIICTTLSSCVGVKMSNIFNKSVNKNRITCCIVDEATKSSEQETLIPLTLNIDKLILVGDPKQLPAVTLSRDAKDLAHGQSLFSRIMSHFEDRSYNPIKMLNVQYRMHPEICQFPNKTYYNGLLKNAKVVVNRESKLNALKPYFVFNLKTDMNNSQVYSNRTEMYCVIKLLDAIELFFDASDTYSVGIITPYNSQKERILTKLKDKRFRTNLKITVNTVDSFQGQEKDIVIMSCVRESGNQFVSNDQRLNVALTRAMHALYVIGSDNLYESYDGLRNLYDDAEERGLFRIIGEDISTSRLSRIIKA